MASIKLLLKSEKFNLKGESPIYIRIIKDRKPRYISTGVYLHEKYWDKENSRVKKSFPNSQHLNNFLAHKIADAQSVALDMETDSKFVSPSKMKLAIMGKSSESFFKFADRMIEELRSKNKYGRSVKAKSIILKVKDYMQHKDLLFSDMDINWLKNYEAYLRSELKNSSNTIYANFKYIRYLLNEAIAEEIYPPEKNPFLRYKLKWNQVKKEFLSEDELSRLENLPLEPGSMKDHHRNMYVFASYTGGLRISDILQLRWKDFDGEKLYIHTQKTGTAVSIKLPTRSLEILNRYQTAESKRDDFIFPIFKKEIDYTDPKTLYQAISSATSYTNIDLKAITKAAGIEKHIHFHTSRHTWATRALSKGMRMEYVSKLMGHTSIRTTQIYAKIVNEDLEKAMEVFN